MQINSRAYVPIQWAENLEHMLALTADRVDDAQQKAHLVGFSLGGYIASLYALKNPAKVASLTLIGYNSAGLTESELQSRKHILKHIQSGKYKGMNKQRLAEFVDATYIDNPAVTQTVQDMSQDLGPAVLRNHIQASTPRQSLTDELAKAKFPISLIAAQNDKIAPMSEMQNMHKKFPGSSLSEVSGSAHMMLLEQPAELAAMIMSGIQKVT